MDKTRRTLALSLILTVAAISMKPASTDAAESQPCRVGHRILGSTRGEVEHLENSSAALEVALSTSIEAIEVDIRVTKDGVPIIAHDGLLRPRTWELSDCPGALRPIERLTFDQIRACTLRNGEPVLTLEKFVDRLNLAVRDAPTLRTVFFDIKVFAIGRRWSNDIDNISATIAGLSAHYDAMFQSMSIQSLKRFAMIRELGDPDLFPETGKIFFLSLTPVSRRRLLAIGADGISLRHSGLQTSLRGRYHDLELAVWTVASKRARCRAMALGADYVIDDAPFNQGCES